MLNIKQHNYWEGVANKKEFHAPLNMKLLSRHIQGFDQPVLDVGCGYGRHLKDLSELGYSNLYGIDYAAGMLQRAQQVAPEAAYILGDSHQLPFQDESMNLVIMVALIGCFPETNSQKKLLHEIYRVLKKGGILYIADFLINSDHINQQRYDAYHNSDNCPYGVFRHSEGPTLRHHSIEYITNITKKVRYKKKHFSEIKILTMNDHLGKGFIYIGEK